MLITDRQYQRLMREFNESGVLAHAAMKADMDPKTARRYVRAGRGPQDLKAKHDWRTRADPIATIWLQAERMLADAPELEAKLLFEHLLAEAAVPALRDALHDENRYVPGYAVEALERIATPDAMQVLLPFLKTARWCPHTSPASIY